MRSPDWPPQIIVIVGPTAVGKTELALSLAPDLSAEVISADSRQVYRHMDIGTGKPTLEQRAAVRHHMIDVVYPDGPFTMADYKQGAERVLASTLASGKSALIVGGSLHYVHGFVDQFVPAPRNLRLRAWLERADQREAEVLNRWLGVLDPTAAAQLDLHNRRRVLRALEVVLTTGRPFSQAGRQQKRALPALWIGLRLDRQRLHDRIQQRTAAMLRAGWLEEVRMLLAMGYSTELPSMTATGYAALADVVRGREDVEGAVERVRRETHAFVRHQETWLRRERRIHWFDGEDPALQRQVMALCQTVGHNQG